MLEMLNELLTLFVVGVEGDFIGEILEGLNDLLCLFTVGRSSSSESEAPTRIGQSLSSSYRDGARYEGVVGLVGFEVAMAVGCVVGSGTGVGQVSRR
jgi:hypothetical protein